MVAKGSCKAGLRIGLFLWEVVWEVWEKCGRLVWEVGLFVWGRLVSGAGLVVGVGFIIVCGRLCFEIEGIYTPQSRINSGVGGNGGTVWEL